MIFLSSLMIGLSLVSGLVILALVAEIYYLFWWRKRAVNRERMENFKNPAKKLLCYCWKKSSSLTSTAIDLREIHCSVSVTNGSDEAHLRPRTCKDFFAPLGGEEESVEAELKRLHNLSGPPRFLFTIKEETKEDLESEGEKSRKGSRGRSLNDLLFCTETPFLTPLPSPPFFTPPVTPIDWYCHHGLNPLFVSSKTDSMCIRVSSSPPPKFKFLKDAEEKFYRRSLMEETLKAQRSNSCEDDVKDHISAPSHPPVTAAITVGKNRGKGPQQLHHSISPQVNPSVSPLPSI